jgi:D-threo-aldose 1-dehydrogenase
MLSKGDGMDGLLLPVNTVSQPFIGSNRNLLYGPDAEIRLGFGCAQLMRLPRRRDRRRLLDAVFEAGLRHFDLARMYGLGMAEREVGRFARGRRDGISIATKFGIDPPGAIAARLQAPARAALAGLPALRRAVKRRESAFAMGAGYHPAAARASLEKSLVELDTDYVDFFFVHDPDACGVADAAGLGSELEALRAEGKVRAWGVSGAPEPVQALTRVWPDVQVQWRESVFSAQTRGEDETPAISFGVLSGALPRIVEHLVDRPERRRWSAALGIDCGDPEALAVLLLREALDRNRRGGVLVADTRPERLVAAVTAVREPPRPVEAEALDAFRLLVGEIEGAGADV